MTISIETNKTYKITINNQVIELTIDEIIELRNRLKDIVNSEFGEKKTNISDDLLDKTKKETKISDIYEKKSPYDWNNIPQFSFKNYHLNKIPTYVGDQLQSYQIQETVRKNYDEFDKLNDKQITQFGLVDDKSWTSLIKNSQYGVYGYKDLVSNINNDNVHSEINTGFPVGNEMW